MDVYTILTGYIKGDSQAFDPALVDTVLYQPGWQICCDD
jgi:hypothetical protein